jgi:predicted ATP-dependent protease
MLKSTLRDNKIRIEEPQREHTLPLLDAPEPKAIPLDVQVIIIGAPRWYYPFFFIDPEFKSYFKVKIDIDPDLPVTLENLKTYAHLIQQTAIHHPGLKVDRNAVEYLTGYSARWAGHREKISARFELIADILVEAATFSKERKSTSISLKDMKDALKARRRRNNRLEDRSYEEIIQNQVLIDTQGEAIGQVNGLAVLTTGDHAYGIPSRITAQTYAGELGVINIERLAELGGPLQQKSALILDGFLNGIFAQKFPVSCSCSITFEQSYGGIEGDSASLAELVAILSSLGRIPLRQDIAVTGSINQFGQMQVVGGVNYKIEGFYQVCKQRGLTGTQGVILPAANAQNLTLHDEVVEDIAANKFFVWPVNTVQEALELLTGKAAGKMEESGAFTKDSVFEAVSQQLEKYHHILSKRRLS